MKTIALELPVDGLPLDACIPGNFADEARFILALKLFEQGRISSGKAGKLCNQSRVEFLIAAGKAGVPLVDLTTAEMIDEFAP